MDQLCLNYVLLHHHLQGASLTLAQRHGLVRAPPKLLSEQQWLATQAKSTARQDSQHECSICCEHFGRGEQVLLSCSHVFHKQCITSFERYVCSSQCSLPGCTWMQERLQLSVRWQVCKISMLPIVPIRSIPKASSSRWPRGSSAQMCNQDSSTCAWLPG